MLYSFTLSLVRTKRHDRGKIGTSYLTHPIAGEFSGWWWLYIFTMLSIQIINMVYTRK